MKLKQIVTVILISAATTVTTLWGYQYFNSSKSDSHNVIGYDSIQKLPVRLANYDENEAANFPDFTTASAAVIPATVHIKTVGKSQTNNLPRSSFPFDDFFEDFFGPSQPRSMPRTGSGSGAIISDDGYIVTNNHVIAGAEDITVTLSNKKTYKAKLIGADPSSDLAVIRIDAKGLPFIIYGNSDHVKVGQWVLAVGYPLSLQTTVTAGIVSAKGRTLDINRRQSATPVESFIQTDAAVNPGNSGGPLVNGRGELIGINSAIASPTGSYAGYSFTIPVNIVKKIVNDLIKHGTVQRAYLGISYSNENIPDEIKVKQGIKNTEGVQVLEVQTNSAAKAAGIEKDDVIIQIDNYQITSNADLVGALATKTPGDKVTVKYLRDGKERSATVTLKNLAGGTDIVKFTPDRIGADLQTIPSEMAKELNIKGGVEIKSIKSNGLFSKVRVQEGYVITKANNKEIKNTEDFLKVIEEAKGTIKIEGIYPGYAGVYPIEVNVDNIK